MGGLVSRSILASVYVYAGRELLQVPYTEEEHKSSYGTSRAKNGRTIPSVEISYMYLYSYILSYRVALVLPGSLFD